MCVLCFFLISTGTYNDVAWTAGLTKQCTNCTSIYAGLTTKAEGASTASACNYCIPGFGGANCEAPCGGDPTVTPTQSATYGPADRSIDTSGSSQCVACTTQATGYSFDCKCYSTGLHTLSSATGPACKLLSIWKRHSCWRPSHVQVQCCFASAPGMFHAPTFCQITMLLDSSRSDAFAFPCLYLPFVKQLVCRTMCGHPRLCPSPMPPHLPTVWPSTARLLISSCKCQPTQLLLN